MTSLSDTLTVGLVLVLLFGSIALYLYTRIQQAEQKISLLESILLDLKMSAEVKSYTELPADEVIASRTSTDQSTGGNYAPFSEDNDDDSNDYYPGAVIDATGSPKRGSPAPSVSSSIDDSADNEVDQYKSIIADAVKEEMTLKELQTLAKTRGITGAGSMKKGAIIEALKTSDRAAGPVEPGSNGTGMGSFLETSSTFQPAVAESE